MKKYKFLMETNFRDIDKKGFPFKVIYLGLFKDYNNLKWSFYDQLTWGHTDVLPTQIVLG